MWADFHRIKAFHGLGMCFLPFLDRILLVDTAKEPDSEADTDTTRFWERRCATSERYNSCSKVKVESNSSSGSTSVVERVRFCLLPPGIASGSPTNCSTGEEEGARESRASDSAPRWYGVRSGEPKVEAAGVGTNGVGISDTEDEELDMSSNRRAGLIEEVPKLPLTEFGMANVEKAGASSNK